MAKSEAALRVQFGALPFSVDENGDVRVLLITTRGNGQWLIPKGWPIRRLTPAASAEQEAYEEAGLIGTVIGSEPLGRFRYTKRMKSRPADIYEVFVYLFLVERQLRKWPEKAERKTGWFAPEEAASLVQSDELAELIQRAVEPARMALLPLPEAREQPARELT